MNATDLAPEAVEDLVSRLKLDTMGLKLDELTEEQKRYISGWEQGT